MLPLRGRNGQVKSGKTPQVRGQNVSTSPCSPGVIRALREQEAGRFRPARLRGPSILPDITQSVVPQKVRHHLRSTRTYDAKSGPALHRTWGRVRQPASTGLGDNDSRFHARGACRHATLAPSVTSERSKAQATGRFARVQHEIEALHVLPATKRHHSTRCKSLADGRAKEKATSAAMSKRKTEPDTPRAAELLFQKLSPDICAVHAGCAIQTIPPCCPSLKLDGLGWELLT